MRSEIAIIFFLFVAGAKAQGLVFNDDAYKRIPTKIDSGAGVKGEEPSSRIIYKVDLKPYCPTVREQGKISSCVGWSVGYAAMTIERAIANGWAGDQKTIDHNAFSAMFLYNQIKLGDCFFGAELNSAFGVLKDRGNVLHREFAVGNNCDSLPAQALVERGRVNRVKEFATLFGPDDKDDLKIARVKRTLAQMKPVVIGMIVLENFLTLKSTDEVWYPNVGKTEIFGGHAMVVIGYDDGRKAFEVMNSWGKGWANQGFVWLRYEDFARYCKYAYQLVMQKQQPGFTPLQGTVHVLKPVLKYAAGGGMKVDFSPLAFQNSKNHFRLKEQVNLPMEFQVHTEGFEANTYLYVISFDNELKPTVHWPRDEKLNSGFAGERESALITSRQPDIILPGKYDVFSLSRPGTEYLCIINSRNIISNLPERLRQIKSVSGELSERVQKAFSAQMSGEFSTNEGGGITFFANGDKADLVSLVLEFQTGN